VVLDQLGADPDRRIAMRALYLAHYGVDVKLFIAFLIVLGVAGFLALIWWALHKIGIINFAPKDDNENG